MASELSQTQAYKDLIAELKSRVQAAQIKAAVSVNTQLIELYWEIGRLIAERQAASGWGEGIIAQIARDLSREFKTMRGFSPRNLFFIKQWYNYYAGREAFVKQLVSQIPWGHNILIMQKIKDVDVALWYARQTLENGWSRNVLGIHIETRLYERQGAAEKLDNFSARLPAASSDLAREALKDPYIFDFLDLTTEAREREIESALVERITRFLLELGKGFAFVGRQYRLEVGGEDFYIDLLFYHLRLRCYVAIELKAGPFKPEYAGKLNFYLTALEREVKLPEDKPSIGLILCKDRNRTVAEYALQGLSQPMGIARYEVSGAPSPRCLGRRLWDDGASCSGGGRGSLSK